MQTRIKTINRARKIIVFLIAAAVIAALPFTAAAKSGYFKLSSDSKRIEYRLANGQKSPNAVVYADNKQYTIENGYVKLINGKTGGKVKTSDKKTYYLENSVTFTGFHSNKFYVNGLVNKKANGKYKIGNKKYYVRKGKLFTGIYNKRYYTNGRVDKSKTGKFKYANKKYFIYKGKFANGIVKDGYYKNGLIDKSKSGMFKANGVKYYVKNGKLFTGLYKKKYYKYGVVNKSFTGYKKFGKKKYYIYKGKLANGVRNGRYYKDGKTDKSKNGMVKYKGVTYYIIKGKLYNGVYKKKYYTNGLVNWSYTGYATYKGKKYFIYYGRFANGLCGNRFYKDGKTDKSVNGFRTIGGYKYYFIKGVVEDPTIANPLKILMVGNSYTYYNGYPQMLSDMIAKTRKSAVVVRATKGGESLPELMDSKLSYVAWKDGKKIASGSDSLDDILNIDFGALKRSGKWDYIIVQNNEDNYNNLSSGDIKFFNHVKGRLKSSKNYIIHGMYYSTDVGTKRYNEHLKAVNACNCSIVNSVSYYAQYKNQFGTKWTDDLTLNDSNHHPSGRGGYLLSLCIYAKIFGTNNFARNAYDGTFIPVYNSYGGYTKEFASDKYNAKSAPYEAMSVNIYDAKLLQAYVRGYSDSYIGDPLYIQNYVLI